MKKDIKEGLKIFVVGVIFIALICGIIYFYKINDRSTIVNSSPKETLNSNEIRLNLDTFIGKWKIGMGVDGFYTVEIGVTNDEKLDFYWTSGPFNGNYNKWEVESYSIQDNKLIVNIEEINQKYIIYQENNKLYCTIENAEDTYFPVEMNKIIDEDEVTIIGLDTKFKKLEKAAIYSIELDEENNIFEFDLDNDGYLNKVLIDTEKDIIKCDDTIEFNNVFIENEEYISHTVYAVDIDKNDSYLDVIVFSKSNKSHDYFILKNIDGKLELIDRNFGYGLGGNKIEAYHIYLNSYNDILWLDQVEENVIPMVTDAFYDLSNGIEEIKVDISNLIIKDQEFITKEKVYFATVENFDIDDYEYLKKNHEILPNGTKFKILEVNITGDYKVELEDGRIGYIFAKYGHL